MLTKGICAWVMRGVVEACASCAVCAIKMCRVVPYAAAGELVHALADTTFVVGEQGRGRVQVSPPTQTRLDSRGFGWSGREKVLLLSSRRLPRLEKCNGNDSSTAIIPRTNDRNSSLPIAPPVPSPVSIFPPIPLPSYFASHPGARCLACLHASPHRIHSINLARASFTAPQRTGNKYARTRSQQST